MKTASLRCIACCIVGVLAAGTAPAQTYDAVAQFSAKKNTDTSIWSYRYNLSGARDGNYATFPFYDNAGGGQLGWMAGKKLLHLNFWNAHTAPVYNTYFPIITANKSKTPWTWATCGTQVVVTVPAHSMFMAPDNSGNNVLSFLAPSAGTATVNYDITDVDPNCGNGILWAVDLNGGNGDLAAGSLHSTDINNLATTGPQTLTVPVNKGDRINLIINGNGDLSGDTTAVTMSVTLTQ